MKTIIEKYLIKSGFTDFKWCWGRKGYYILATRYGVQSCIDLMEVVNEIINDEGD